MAKILLLENDPAITRRISEVLKKEGYEVETETDGKIGLEKLKASPPDLLILDAELPTYSGLEILQSKSGANSLKHIPIILVSSGTASEIDKALFYGVLDYIIRSNFTTEEVSSKVCAQITGKLSRRSPLENTAALKGAEGGAHEKGSLVGKAVLWVESDKFLSDILAKKLEEAGCELIHAENAAQAKELLHKSKPDLMITEILLPDENGFELLKEVKEEENLKHVPVIILSNLGQESDIRKGKEAGAESFLVKATVSFDEIVREIARVLRR